MVMLLYMSVGGCGLKEGYVQMIYKHSKLKIIVVQTESCGWGSYLRASEFLLYAKSYNVI